MSYLIINKYKGNIITHTHTHTHTHRLIAAALQCLTVISSFSFDVNINSSYIGRGIESGFSKEGKEREGKEILFFK